MTKFLSRDFITATHFLVYQTLCFTGVPLFLIIVNILIYFWFGGIVALPPHDIKTSIYFCWNPLMSILVSLIIYVFYYMSKQKPRQKNMMMKPEFDLTKYKWNMSAQKIYYLILTILLFLSHFVYDNTFWSTTNYTGRIITERLVVLIIYFAFWMLDYNYVKKYEMENKIDTANKTTQELDMAVAERSKEIKLNYGFYDSKQAYAYGMDAFLGMLFISLSYLAIIFLADPVLTNTMERNVGFFSLIVFLIYKLAYFFYMKMKK